MKIRFLKTPALVALCLLPVFQSCLDSGNDYDPSLLIPDALVTVKPVAGDYGQYYMQLDDDTVLYPADYNEKAPYDKEVRAFLKYNEVPLLTGSRTSRTNDTGSGSDAGSDSGSTGNSGDDSGGSGSDAGSDTGSGDDSGSSDSDDPQPLDHKYVEIVWLDSILTKPAVNTLGSTEADTQEYGCDPVEIYKGWTVVEDGYLTVHFLTKWGNSGIKHYLNLVTGTNPDDPYEVVFRHNNYDDIEYYDGDGIVAFKLDNLPDTQGKTVKLTMKYMSFYGEKSITFDYKTRKD